jgi:hypothetical protein
MNSSTISADIISFTSLADEDKRKIELNIKQLISDLTDRYKDQGFYGRTIQGDYIEFALKSPVYALRIALLLKTFIKSFELTDSTEISKRLKYFKEYGVRIAIAVAPLSTLDPENGIIDGEAIYLSGRFIKDMSTSDKQKIVIKGSLFFCNPDKQEQEKYDAMFSLLDTIISGCSPKQCEVLYYKLLDTSEKEIGLRLNRVQSTISQHSTAVGWNAIEKTINYFEKYIN